jgi:glycine/D-amino acid oxidase-like deaminating enzyme
VKQADIIVVGAGLVGLTTAMALRQAGFRPLVIEAGEDDAAAASILPPWRLPALLQGLAASMPSSCPSW